MSTAYAIAPPLFEPEGGEPTLDDVLVGAWEGLTAHRAVDCPVCGGEMAPAYGGHAPRSDDPGDRPAQGTITLAPAPAAGRCGSCGSELS
jgi:hypothetical protein